jgi:hypothetical protein
MKITSDLTVGLVNCNFDFDSPDVSWMDFSYFCITLVKIRNAALQKKRKPNLKILIQIPNVIYCEGMIRMQSWDWN